MRLLNLSHRDEQKAANEKKKKDPKNLKKSVKSNRDTQKIRIYDAFTLELETLENSKFFFEIMAKVNNNQDSFLKQELM